MDLDDVEIIDVRALRGTDAITVVMSAAPTFVASTSTSPTLGGSASDFVADTVTVVGTNGVDTIVASAVGAAAR